MTDPAPVTIDRGAVAALRLARRLDWRFLLPGGQLGRVAVVGDVAPELLAALAAEGVEIAPAGTVHSVLLRDPTPADVAEADERLEPGGWVYIELSSARARRRARVALARRRFEPITAHWHWRVVGAATAIVPLDDRPVLRYALARRQRRRAAALLAGVAVRLRLLGPFVAATSVVARKPGGDASGVPAHLPSCGRGDRFLLLTPAFRASRHVVALVFEGRARVPGRVVKVPRLASQSDGVAREAEALRILGAEVGAAGGAPALLGLETSAGRPWLVEAAVLGEPLDRRAVRHDPSAAVDRVSAWLAALPVGSPSESSEARFDRLLGGPLRRLRGVLADVPEVVDLVDTTLDLVAPLRTAQLPSVFEHGDVSHPNLVQRPDGGLTAIDWELSETSGLPLHDLVFFLAFVADSVADASTYDASVAAFDEAVLGETGWGRPALLREAARVGVDQTHVPALVVASWARRVTGALERLGMMAEPIDPEIVSAVMATIREHTFWQHVVAALTTGHRPVRPSDLGTA